MPTLTHNTIHTHTLHRRHAAGRCSLLSLSLAQKPVGELERPAGTHRPSSPPSGPQAPPHYLPTHTAQSLSSTPLYLVAHQARRSALLILPSILHIHQTGPTRRNHGRRGGVGDEQGERHASQARPERHQAQRRPGREVSLWEECVLGREVGCVCLRAEQL